MTAPSFSLLLFTLLAAFGTAALTLAMVAVVSARRPQRPVATHGAAEFDTPMSFLFSGDVLVDATPEASHLLERAGRGAGSLRDLAAILRHRFPGLDSVLSRLDTECRIELAGIASQGGCLIAQRLGQLTRIAIFERDVPDLPDHHAFQATQAELDAMRTIVQVGPTVIWKQSADGTVTWANDAYFSLVRQAYGEDDVSWPPPALFAVSPSDVAEPGDSPMPFRAALQITPDGPEHWYECHGYLNGDETVCYAVRADSLVRTEQSLRDLVQSLARTFADLPIGLAVFDRDRRLATFNPALSDLTLLDVEFLAARPTLFTFLDRLRDQRRIPEPRDYKSWRERMMRLESAAAGGFVQEDWHLPSGQTFRVTGRPHPDGAVGFLIQDISAEVSLTRKFRSELELGQAVLDSLDEAIAVFSPAGVLMMANAAYADLWGYDPSSRLAQTGAAEATRLWQSRTAPTPIWGDVRDFLSEPGDRAAWDDTVRMTDGRVLDCRFQPISGGATLVAFREVQARPRRRRNGRPKAATQPLRATA